MILLEPLLYLSHTVHCSHSREAPFVLASAVLFSACQTSVNEKEHGPRYENFLEAADRFYTTSKLAVLLARLQAPLHTYLVVVESEALRDFLKSFLTCISVNEASPLC